MTSVFLTFLEYQICLVLGITSWLFAITAYQKTLFHKDFPAFWPSNILVETCWHLQFWRFVVGPFSYLVHVLYIGFDLLLTKQRNWQDLSKSGWRVHSPPPPNLNILLLWPMCVQSSHFCTSSFSASRASHCIGTEEQKLLRKVNCSFGLWLNHLYKHGWSFLFWNSRFDSCYTFIDTVT